MGTAIHVDIDILCMIILAAIAFQSRLDVNQEMRRVLFRWLVYGILLTLFLDAVWILIDGKMFPFAIPFNRVINAVFLALGVLLGGIWYLYVLETMNYRMTPALVGAVMAPGLFFLVLNLASIWTGWTFYVDASNVYARGPLFWLQTIGAVCMLLVSLVHILIYLIVRRKDVEIYEVWKLLTFYIIPVCGTLVSIPYTGMPGTWTCASVSIVLIYIDNQDREILIDSLTGLNNRKNLNKVYTDYVRQVSAEKQLYLFMLDLDDFKGINDTYGHTAGDKALRETAKLLKKAASNRQSIVLRFGGDEFLIMGFFRDDEEAENFRREIRGMFREWNEESKEEYRLKISCGYSRYADAKPLQGLIEEADSELYADKSLNKRLKMA